MVNVKLKRKMKMNNHHKTGLINPIPIYDCLNYLVKNHASYKNIKIEKEEIWKKQCPDYFSSKIDGNKSESDDADSTSDEADENQSKNPLLDEDKNILDENNDIIEEAETADPNKPDYMASTCLYPKEPAATVIVNRSKKNLKIKKKRKNEKCYDYAPGEEQIPSNWIRHGLLYTN